MSSNTPLFPSGADVSKVKVVLLGELGVGKTSLFLQFAEGSFFEKDIPVLEDPVKMREFPIDDARVAIEVWDTAGHEAFRAVTASHFRGADGVVFVFDLTNRESFEALERWNEDCDANVGKRQIRKMLIGCKRDLPAAVVTKQEAESWATQKGMQYFECSAKTGHGVIEAFTSLARECRRIYTSHAGGAGAKRGVPSSTSHPLRASSPAMTNSPDSVKSTDGPPISASGTRTRRSASVSSALSSSPSSPSSPPKSPKSSKKCVIQ